MRAMIASKNLKGTHRFVLKNRLVYLVFILTISSFGESLFAHGTVTTPPSRVWTCYQEGPESPDSPACIAAVATHGTQPLYDWNAINQGFADGDHIAVVPNGNLASGGDPNKYGGLDKLGSDWLATSVEPGPYTVTWTNSAPHASLYYRVYITTDDWTPDQELAWNKLTLLVETAPSAATSVEDIPLILPSKTGRHVLFSVWQRSDSQEAFYSVSDIDFGGGDDNDDDEDDDDNEGGDDNNVIVDGNLMTDNITVNSGTGVVFEITNEGDIFLPQFADGSDKLLGIDGTGKLVEGTGLESSSATVRAFSKYDFPAAELNSGYSISRIGAHFIAGTVVGGISAHLLDNNQSTGADDNSISVKLIRRNKANNTLPDHVIYEVIAGNTGMQVFSPFATTTLVYPGSNIIDNDTYVYFIEVMNCDDCDFREVIIAE